MPLTSVWNIPYAVGTDAPNGPSQEAAIANAVETALNTINANAIATALANSKTYPRLLSARLSANQVVTGTADLTGCTLTFTTAQANTVVKITVNATSSNSPTFYMQTTTVIDGTTQAESCYSAENSVVSTSPSASITLVKTLAASGSHTIKLQAISAGGTTTAISPHTGLVLEIVGP